MLTPEQLKEIEERQNKALNEATPEGEASRIILIQSDAPTLIAALREAWEEIERLKQ